MKKSLKKAVLSTTASLIHATTVKTVNSACSAIWGQEKEPTSLKRYKKSK